MVYLKTGKWLNPHCTRVTQKEKDFFKMHVPNLGEHVEKILLLRNIFITVPFIYFPN